MTENTNTNCLEDMECPSCGQFDSFRIEATTTATEYDSGTDDTEGCDYDDLSYATCPACGWAGHVADLYGDDPADLAARCAAMAMLTPFGARVDDTARVASLHLRSADAVVSVTRGGDRVRLVIEGLTPAEVVEMLAARDNAVIPTLLAALQAAPTDGRTP